MDIYTLYAATFGATTLPAKEESIDYTTQEIIDGNSGSIVPTWASIGRAQPQASFTTASCKLALAAIGVNALALTSGAPGRLYFRAKINLGGNATTSVNQRRTISSGLVVPVRITAPEPGPDSAQVQYDIHTIWDGTGGGAPVVVEQNQALAGSWTGDRLFAAGPVKLNGSIDPKIISWSLDFGFRIFKAGDSGTIHDTWAGIMRMEPRLTFASYDLDYVRQIGWQGLPLTSVVAYLRARKSGSSFETDATAAHIKFTATSGVGIITRETASHGDTPARAEFTVPVVSDGSNAILAIDTASTIS